MKKVLLSFFLAMTLAVAFSQRKPDREFIVNTKGDTIFGTVLMRNSRNLRQIEFKDPANQSHFYSSADVVSFYDAEWGLFVSSVLSFQRYGLNKEETSRTAPASFFLETIVQSGKISIYHVRNRKYGSHFFIHKEDSLFEELILHESIKVVSGKRVIDKGEQFKATLARYLVGCPNIQEAINKTILSKGSLQNLIMKYGSCFSQKPEYQGKIDYGEWSFGTSAGWARSTARYTDIVPFGQFYTASYTPYTTFTMGLSANYFFSKRSRRVSIFNELLYKKLNMSRTLPYSPYDRFNYQFNYLRLNTFVRYHFLRAHKMNPFLMAGISNNFAITTKTTWTTTSSYPAADDRLDTRRYELGLLAGVGISLLKKVDAYVKFETTNGFRPLNDTAQPHVHSVYFGLTYWFK